MKFLLTIAIIILPFFISCQYTQNIDTLTKKELRQLLKVQSYSEKAANLSDLSRGLEITSILGYTFGTGLMIYGFTYEPKNDADDKGILMYAMGVWTNIATTVIFQGSAAYIRGRARRAYRKSIPPTSTSQIRDASKIDLMYSD